MGNQKNIRLNRTFRRWLPFESPFLSSACPRFVLSLSLFVPFSVFLCLRCLRVAFSLS